MQLQLLYASGTASFDQQNAAIQTGEALGGIKITLKSEPFNTLVATTGTCTAASHPAATCDDWQIQQYGYNTYGLDPSVALTVLFWPYASRLVRAQVLSLRTREFVAASTAMGSTRTRILIRHMQSNTFNIFIVTTTFAIADSIYALSALSFLGLGPPPPFADWGTMLTTGVNDLFDSYPWEVYPALIILVVTILAFRYIGDALNDIGSARTSVR